MTTESPPPHRNLVLCFDDNVLTWQDFLLTNLHNMTRVLRTATEGRRKQVIWHHKGPLAKDVGKKTQKLPTDTQEDLQVKRKARLNTVPEPGIVWDPKNTAIEGYIWLAQNYKPGDNIIVFGASRGAYIARAFAGLLATVKLVPQSTQEQANKAWDAYVACLPGGDDLNKVRGLAQTFRDSQAGFEVRVYFLGLWDTLAPEITETQRPRTRFFSKKPHPVNHPLVSCMAAVVHVRHAMALQEERACMDPLPYVSGHTTSEEMLECGPTHGIAREEVWFLGRSSHVVGGARMYRNARLDGIALRWMMREACLYGEVAFEPEEFFTFKPLADTRLSLEDPTQLRDLRGKINFDVTPQEFDELVYKLLSDAAESDHSMLMKLSSYDSTRRDLMAPDEIESDDLDELVIDQVKDEPTPTSLWSRLHNFIKPAKKHSSSTDVTCQEIHWLKVIPPQRTIAPLQRVHATVYAVAHVQVARAIKQSGLDRHGPHGMPVL